MRWEYLQGQAIDISRNMLCRHFLEQTNFDYLLMHDSDATWHPGAVERLVSRNLPVVTAVIFKRSLPTVPTIGKNVSQGVRGETLYSFAGTINRIVEKAESEKLTEETSNRLLFDPHPDDIEEVDGAGCHFMLIRRDVLEKMAFPYFECTSVNGGEDFDFCRKVQKAGFKIYVDYSVFTGHVVGDSMEIGVREFMLYRDKTKKLDEVWKV